MAVSFLFLADLPAQPGDQDTTPVPHRPLGPGASLGVVFGVLPASLSLSSNLPITHQDIYSFRVTICLLNRDASERGRR